MVTIAAAGPFVLAAANSLEMGIVAAVCLGLALTLRVRLAVPADGCACAPGFNNGALAYKKKARCFASGLRINPGSDLLSHALTHAVPSAVEGLTSVFGMGTGVTPLL
jgi:hypothetical protein